LELLRNRNIPDHRLRIVRQVVNFASSNKSQGDSGDLLTADNVKSFTKKMIKGLKGVENIYTQHSPLVAEVVQELCRGKLKAAHYPYLGTVQLNERPREVIVFQVGGTTYEESLAIHNLNQSSPGTRVIVGGSAVHNSCSFLEEVAGMQRQVL
jgi:vacuolar protein sorting-associated protein 45